jgi:hypothetical protein
MEEPMTIYKMDKLYTFHISKEERQAINELRRNGIIVSRFLRRELRKFADELRLNKEQNGTLKEDCWYECNRR